MGPLLLLIPLLIILLPFTSSSPSTSDLTPISRFLLSLPSNFPNPGPFQDTSPEDSDVISMNKKLAKSEGGISGLVSKAVKSGGRGASAKYVISKASPPGRRVRVAERNSVVLLGNMLCDFLDPHYLHDQARGGQESPVKKYEVMRITPNHDDNDEYPRGSPRISCTIYAIPDDLYPSDHLSSFLNSFSPPPSPSPTSASNSTTLICVFHSSPLPLISSLRHLVLNPLSPSSTPQTWGRGVKTLKDASLKAKVGVWGFGYDYVLRRGSWSHGPTTTANTTLAKVFSDSVTSLSKSHNTTKVILTGYGLSSGIAGLLSSCDSFPPLYKSVKRPWYKSVPSLHAYLLSPPPLFTSSLPHPSATSLVHGSDPLPRCTLRSAADARNGRTGIKEGLKLHAEGRDGGGELGLPGGVFYVAGGGKEEEGGGGWRQVYKVGERGRDMRAEGIWGIRRLVGKKAAVEDGRYESYRRAIKKGELGEMES
ncbi:hypothetical protein TrCOL_g602 [Triparma columacea]|uniref:Uncharacterized protein n=1 Tax=Triparma columacea TaxID=722753 RepID=A0A9W7LBK8_9STRA|nr:hypothetical protein TrCOL_g602 [Triparma columacea]